MTPVEARLLEIDGGSFAFVRADGETPYWLCIGEAEPAYRMTEGEIDMPEERLDGTRKLCALLGLTWEEIEAKPDESAGWQLACMERLGPNMRAKLRGSTPDEILEWRQQLHTLEPGEVLRERLTGEDPLAGRN